MAKFFFHVRQGNTLFEDLRGGQFQDLRAAWRWAAADARMMIAEGSMQGQIDEHWIEICDATGTILATMPFRRALPMN